MTDLERIKQYHDWLGDKYEIVNNIEDKEWNQTLIVGQKGDWYWIFYMFKDGKLIQHWLSE